MAQACNSARNGHDVQDSWDSVLSIVDQYGANILHFAEAARPGFWNDPDMVIFNFKKLILAPFKILNLTAPLPEILKYVELDFSRW